MTRELAAIPSWYKPYAHLLATTGVGLATLVVSILAVHRVRALELVAIPATILLSNAVEWE